MQCMGNFLLNTGNPKFAVFDALVLVVESKLEKIESRTRDKCESRIELVVQVDHNRVIGPEDVILLSWRVEKSW